MRPLTRPALTIVLCAILAAMLIMLAGCSTTLNQLAAEETQDYHETVVQGVLLPHYLADPEIPPPAKQNITAATTKHEALISEWLQEAGLP